MMIPAKSVPRVLSVVLLFGLVVGVYLLLIRPSQLRWGASNEELARAMPGDELLAESTFLATRAVTIEDTLRSQSPDGLTYPGAADR